MARSATENMARKGKNARQFMNNVPCGRKIMVMIKGPAMGETCHERDLS
jgi:hypothetical protein